MMFWMIITVILGLVFVGFEIYEFAHYASEGVNPTIGSFWSSFFILLGTHGAHVSLGIVWVICLLIQIGTRGLDSYNAPKLFIVSLYWHFLDVVWVFIFTAVYMIGMVYADEYNRKTYSRFYCFYRTNAFSSFVTLYTNMTFHAKVTIIFGFAFIQAALQLLMFMHLTEGKDGRLQSFKVIFAIIITLVTVIGTYWVMQGGHSSHL